MGRSTVVTRRSFLASSVAITGGCLRSGSSRPTDTESDGYPPPFDDQPEGRTVHTDDFSRISVDGVLVPLAPIDVSYYWFRRREARFADVRARKQYEASHILGSVHSPAFESGAGDPALDWPKTDRIVCYCGCPHHLSSIRAARLIQDGYESVYVIDEGFWEWNDRDYPIAGAEDSPQPSRYEISGRTDPEHAGRWVWAIHPGTKQREVTRIDTTGRYLVGLRFFDVTRNTPIVVRTPSYRVRAPLANLTTGEITRSGTLQDATSA